jgi:hypothetical protein
LQQSRNVLQNGWIGCRCFGSRLIGRRQRRDDLLARLFFGGLFGRFGLSRSLGLFGQRYLGFLDLLFLLGG